MKIPESKAWLVDGFCRYTHRMVKGRFHAFAVQFAEPPPTIAPNSHALVVYANHVSWWDPIVAMLLRKSYFPDRVLYAPIDAAALKAYRVFSKMGFFGIELDRFQGAAEFLKTSRAILSNPQSSLWVTPEGRFTDCRDHSQPLMPGLAHLAASFPSVSLVPLAIEYPFWEEPRPMIAVRFGPRQSYEGHLSKRECGERLHEALRQTQRDLASAVMQREAEAFEYLIAPRAARTSWYDTIRAWTAWYHGQPFDPRHSAVTRNSQS
ncbi:MAG: lysophospholipid acyltransferase family protein [Planctomycetota bacterium]|jgi:1-acyl-sn-glycerol-3-phosphate acyltransferase